MKNFLCLIVLVLVMPVGAVFCWDAGSYELSAPSTVDNVLGAALMFATIVSCLFLIRTLWRRAWASARSLTNFNK